jgi:hypothetical protein
MTTDTITSVSSDAFQTGMNDKEKQHQTRLEQQKKRTQLNRANESEEQRQIRLENERKRSHSKRATETEEKRQVRLENDRIRSHSKRATETEQQRQIRLEKKKEQTRSSRTKETEEQRQIRLQQQRKQSQVNRAKKKLEKEASGNNGARRKSVEMQFSETDGHEPCDSNSINDFAHNENVTKRGTTSIRPPWPASISSDLKRKCLQQFIQQMSMAELAETVCAVCNMRASEKKGKKLPLSKIPNIHLLKVSDEIKDLIAAIQPTMPQYPKKDAKNFRNDNSKEATGHDQSTI